MFNCFSFADTRDLLKSSVDCELDCTTKADPLIMFTWCSLNTNWSESLQETKRRHEWAQDSDHVLHLCGEILMLSRNKQKPAAAEKKKSSLRSKTFLARDPVTTRHHWSISHNLFYQTLILLLVLFEYFLSWNNPIITGGKVDCSASQSWDPVHVWVHCSDRERIVVS